MPEQIISASGLQYGLIVNSDGSINTTASISSGTSIETGSNVWVKNFPTTQDVSISGTPLVVVSGIDVNIGSAIFNLEDIYEIGRAHV